MNKVLWRISMMLILTMLAPLARAGDLNPPGAPAPTMHTLEEIYQQLTNSQAAILAANQQLVVATQQIDALQQQVANLESRLSADGKYVTSGHMVLIPAGEFVMGAATNVGHEFEANQTPQHTVYVSAFYMDKYEVTSNLWREVFTWATNRGYSFGIGWSGKSTNHPVHSVDWYDAIAWCNARSQRDGFTPCYTNANGTVYTNAAANSFTGGCNWAASGYRLPTEAEWEKAARGGKANTRFPWDDVNTIQHARANYNATIGIHSYDTSPTLGYHPETASPNPRTLPVGSFAPNAYGLYDMAGNIFEWCWDWLDLNYYFSSPDIDPRGPDSGSTRLIRGGSYGFQANQSRVAYRSSVAPSVSAYDDIGFRCVRGL